MEADIYEISHRRKRFFIIGAIISLFTLIGLGIWGWQSLTIEFSFPLEWWLVKEMRTFTSIGIFFLSLFGSLFFIPLPLETFFAYSIFRDNPLLITLIGLLIGGFIGNSIDYFIGMKLSKISLYFFSRKQVYKVKRNANAWGSYAVFFVNLIPFLPSPVLSFALGITKYNYKKFISFCMLGMLIKYGVIGLVIYFTNNSFL